METTCLTTLEFCAAHRVQNHHSCDQLHGHNYVAEFECSNVPGAAHFVELHVAAWIMEFLDYSTILYNLDQPLAEAWDVGGHLSGHKLYRMQEDPTVENIAKLLLETAQNLLGKHDIVVMNVTLHESSTRSASVSSE